MCAEGKISEAIVEKDYIIGGFFPKSDLRYSEKVEVAFVKFAVRGRKEEPHFHEKADEVTILIKGHVEVEVNDKVVSLYPRGSLFIKAGSVHRRIDAMKGTEMFVIKAPSLPDDKHFLRK